MILFGESSLKRQQHYRSPSAIDPGFWASPGTAVLMSSAEGDFNKETPVMIRTETRVSLGTLEPPAAEEAGRIMEPSEELLELREKIVVVKPRGLQSLFW